ncbi:MAG: hypothetical protein AAF411_06540 [Myxococcota bacterium]
MKRGTYFPCVCTVAFVGCGDDAARPAEDAAVVEEQAVDMAVESCQEFSTLGQTCASALDCDDGCFCNGMEVCGAEGICEAGESTCVTDVECAVATCDEETDLCEIVGDHGACSDGNACNGVEVCDIAFRGCRSGEAPFCNDDDSCTVDSCDARTGCVFLARDLDGDGFRDGRCGGNDCDDDPRFGTNVFPGATEDCFNRRDDNCDGLRDFDDSTCIPINGSCESARELPGPGTYSAATRTLLNSTELSCGQTSRPDAYFRLTIDELSDLRITVAASVASGVAFRRADACSEGPSEDLGCGSGSPAVVRRRSVEPGEYVIIVEQASLNAFELTVVLSEPTEIPNNDICNAETDDISEGGTFSGFFSEVSDDYALTCTGGRTVPEAAYRLSFDEPRDLLVTGTADRGLPVLSLTGDCSDGSRTLTCQNVGTTSPLRVRDIPAGEYFLLIESTDTRADTYEITAEVSEPTPRTPGDNCANLVDITPPDGETMAEVSLDLADLDLDGGTTCGGSRTGIRDAFISFTLDEASDVVLRTTSDGAFHHASLRSSCTDIGSELLCRGSNATNVLRFRSLEPGTYYAVVSRQSSVGMLDVRVEVSPPTPIPENDQCEQAIDIGGGYSSIDTLFGFEDDLPGCVGIRLVDAFYTFTLTDPKDVLISARRADGTLSSLTLTLRDGCEGEMNLGCDSGSPSIISRTLEAGTYVVFVESSSSFATEFILQASFFDPL